MNNQINHIELISSYLSGNSDAADRVLLTEWLHQSPENSRIFEEMKQTWVATSVLSTAKKFNSHNAYKFNEFEKTIRPKVLQLNRQNLLKIAAVLLVMVLMGGIVSYFITRSVYQPIAAETCSIEAPIGSRAIASLPDGTKVWLNAGSKLEYTTQYNKKNREVLLTGEGFFKVSHNPAKPFLVKANNVNIKALGTSFNVKAYPGENQVTTTLVEGKVELNGKGVNNQNFTYLMKPKQKVTYYNDNKLFKTIAKNNTSVKETPVKTTGAIISKEELPLQSKAPLVSNSNVKTELYTSWKDERWIIESENLGELAILFERRYNVHITFENDEMKYYRFSGTIQNETIEQIFDIMRFTLPISYLADKGEITLKADKKLKKIYKLAYKQE